MQRKSSESVLIDLARQSLAEFFTGGEKEDQELPVDDETVGGAVSRLDLGKSPSQGKARSGVGETATVLSFV